MQIVLGVDVPFLAWQTNCGANASHSLYSPCCTKKFALEWSQGQVCLESIRLLCLSALGFCQVPTPLRGRALARGLDKNLGHITHLMNGFGETCLAINHS
ncbi:MAG: hypothetical protein FD128_884 [Hyphomonadaceae bacterium]|nr:MAG: hypothetical protein FD128_884 [Hyphomonadaceae bacterium]